MDNENAIYIGQRIRQYREARNMTREQLAEIVGLDTGYLGMCERGERQLGLSKTLDIICFFGITPNDIFPNKDTAISLNQEERILEINELLKDFSDNQLTAVFNIIKSINILR